MIHDFLFNFLTVYWGLLGSGPSKLLKFLYSIRGEVFGWGNKFVYTKKLLIQLWETNHDFLFKNLDFLLIF